MNVEFDAKIRDFAALQKRIVNRLEALEAERDALYTTYVKPLENEMHALSAEMLKAEGDLKAEALAHIQATGELDIHPALTFRRATKVLYDDEEMLSWAVDNKQDLVLSRSIRLNVRMLEKLIRDGELPEAPAEIVPAPQVALGRLGEYVLDLEDDGL